MLFLLIAIPCTLIVGQAAMMHTDFILIRGL
jgi:hypothetical protein